MFVPAFRFFTGSIKVACEDSIFENNESYFSFILILTRFFICLKAFNSEANIK